MSVAIVWYWALAQMLERTGVNPDDVFDLVDAWMKGKRPVRLRSATDPATGLISIVVWGRADGGRPLAIFARRTGRDIQVYNALELGPDQVAELEKWEATHNE